MSLELHPRPSRLRCPYCHERMAGGLVRCACGARFHRACALALGTCATLGCGADVRPRGDERRARGLEVAVLPRAASVVLLGAVVLGVVVLGVVVLGVVVLTAVLERRGSSGGAELRGWFGCSHGEFSLRLERAPATVADLSLRLSPPRIVRPAEGVVHVGVAVTNFAASRATLVVHPSFADLDWRYEEADLPRERLPRCCREGWSPLEPGDFVAIDPGKTWARTYTLHLPPARAAAGDLHLELDLHPSPEGFERHMAEAPYFFAVLDEREKSWLRSSISGAIRGVLRSPPIAIER